MTTDEAFRIIFLILFIAFMGVRAYYGRKTPWTKRTRKERKEDLEQEGIASAIVLLGLWIVYMIWAFLYLIGFAWIEWSFLILNVEFRLLGIIPMLIAIPYVMWAHKTLGACFTATISSSEESRLITEGPYTRVRHPIYSAHTCFNIGVILITANSIFLILLLIGIPYTYQRMFKEEKKLIEQFGEEYEDYIQRTGRIFPKIQQ